MPQPLSSINVTAFITVAVSSDASVDAGEKHPDRLLSTADALLCSIGNHLGDVAARGVNDRPTTPPPAAKQHMDEDSICNTPRSPFPTPRRLVPARNQSTQNVSAMIPLAPLLGQHSGKRTSSDSAHAPLPVRVLHRRVPVTTTDRIEHDICIQIERRRPSCEGTCTSGEVVVPAVSVASAVREWNVPRLSGNGAPRQWKHAASKVVYFDLAQDLSPCRGLRLCVVVDIILSCEPSKLTAHQLHTLLDVSRSPSNISVNDSVCSNASTAARSARSGGALAHDSGSRPGSFIGDHFPSRLWEDAFAVHAAHVHACIYRPLIVVLDQQFDAAVDELVTVEALMTQQLKEKDDVIAALESQHAAVDCAAADTSNVSSAAASQQNDAAPQPDNAAVGSEPPPSVWSTVLKQKDTEIFLLRARIAAMESARAEEVKSFRDEVAALRESRQLALKQKVQRAASTRRLASATLQRNQSPKSSFVPRGSQPQRTSVSPAGNLRNVGRENSVHRTSPSTVGLTAGKRASTSTSRGLDPSRPREASATRQPSQQSVAQRPIPRHVDAAERDERLRKLEESYAKLQLRHAAARETADALGAGSASAADFLAKSMSADGHPVTGVRELSGARRESPARGPFTGQASSVDVPAAHRRNVSPLRIPKLVPGLKLSDEQRVDIEEVEHRSMDEKAQGSLRRGQSPLSRRALPLPLPKQSLLRTSPLRMSEKF